MKVAIITGSAGLIGAEAARFFTHRNYHVVGIDNDMRRVFFGDDASTRWCRLVLEETLPHYVHHDVDIRQRDRIDEIFREYSSDISAVVHTAAQPSHDFAAQDPHSDFSVNAVGTSVLLEACRQYSPAASFIFASTNKVYGDHPNFLPLVEQAARWEIDASHPYFARGIDEQMSVDQTTHSLFGVSKLAADSLVQEYGRRFDMNTVCFRAGCLTGPGHAGAMLHGFLSYLVKCTVTGTPYTVFGYGGKQVRDNMHAFDLVNMFWQYHQNPRPSAVYNAGGGRHSHCSLQEAIAISERLTGKKLNQRYVEDARTGDHIWYISDTRKFETDYPSWSYTYDLETTMQEIVEATICRSEAT